MEKLKEFERVTIVLYQEKIQGYQNLLTQFINELFKKEGLEPKDYSINLQTGEITKTKPDKIIKEKTE